MSTAFAIVAVENGATLVLPETAFTERQRDAIAHIITHRGVDALPPTPGAETDPATPAASPSDAIRRQAMAEAARAQGFTGDTCGRCGSASMKRNGSCLCCTECGETTGCS